MIELLKIHALVHTARMLVFVGSAADEFSKARCRSAGRILDDVTAWMNARGRGRRYSEHVSDR